LQNWKKVEQERYRYFKSLKEDEIVKCHHTLGRWIRNNWELGRGALSKFFSVKPYKCSNYYDFFKKWGENGMFEEEEEGEEESTEEEWEEEDW
jgi:hypothetical protein